MSKPRNDLGRHAERRPCGSSASRGRLCLAGLSGNPMREAAPLAASSPAARPCLSPLRMVVFSCASSSSPRRLAKARSHIWAAARRTERPPASGCTSSSASPCSSGFCSETSQSPTARSPRCWPRSCHATVMTSGSPPCLPPHRHPARLPGPRSCTTSPARHLRRSPSARVGLKVSPEAVGRKAVETMRRVGGAPVHGGNLAGGNPETSCLLQNAAHHPLCCSGGIACFTSPTHLRSTTANAPLQPPFCCLLP